MRKLEIPIKLKTSLSIGGFTSPSIFVDGTTAREESGPPLIPASAIKGAIRIELEKLIRAKGLPCCLSPKPETMCPPNSPEPCLACQIFGGPGREGKIRISNGIVVNKSLRQLFEKEEDGKNIPTGFGYEVRHGVSISRKLKTAKEERLFSKEIVSNFSSLKLVANMLEKEPLNSEELEWLKKAAASVTAIGGDRSRGLGWVEMELREIQVQHLVSSKVDPLKGKSIKIVITLDEDLNISDAGSPGYFLKTLDYIPASTLRGGLANKLKDLLSGGFGNPLFKKLFLDPKDSLIFSNAYPYSEGIETKPIPLTARTCKAWPGFRDEGGDGVWDILIPELINKDIPKKCNKCPTALEPLDGYYLANFSGSYLIPLKVSTKTALNRKLGTSQEGMLYSLESIEKGEKFIARIKSPSEEVINNLLDTLTLKGILFLGHSKSRGQGHIRFELRKDDASGNRLSKRFEGFNRKILQLQGEDPDAWENQEERFLSLTLLSDLLLPLEERGYPYKLYSDTLRKYFKQGLNGLDLKLVRSYVRTNFKGGWNDAHKLPKEGRWAIECGSVFLYSLKSNDEEITKKLLEDLERIEDFGLGLKTQEGFGQVRVCDEFHFHREVL